MDAWIDLDRVMPIAVMACFQAMSPFRSSRVPAIVVARTYACGDPDSCSMSGRPQRSRSKSDDPKNAADACMSAASLPSLMSLSLSLR